jgi:broad specificity phosphatase PhoE
LDLLLLCRAESEAVAAGLVEGSRSWPLTPEGARQAQRLGKRLAHDYRIVALYTSSLEEAAMTAEHVGQAIGLAPVVLPDLREVDRGELAGRPRQEMRLEEASAPRSADIFTPFPGGEAYAEMHVRVVKAINALVQEAAGRTIAVVTHPGPIQAYLLAFLRYAIEQRSQLRLCCDPASLHHLRRREDGRKEIVRLNDLGHESSIVNRQSEIQHAVE